ncbi:sulfotransferase domain-containing protein [Salegentibacter sp. UBA1130]|uniref:sulfotransferase domain-containing protein n=1 Tax=Salegentibacter sp. UBA1130 TaxID=1947451 RepID=UPI0025794795|nr:sulfotransferase domain-containing protein [Salegentibacter sp. UBA1130]
MFGNHYFPEENKNISPKLYIYRDGRAVAYSVWKTENFLHKELKEYDFNEFLEMKIDWSGSPANEALEEFTILDHWATHVKSWKQFANNNPNVCLIKYEDLLSQPHDEYLRIYNHFQNLFPSHVLKKKDELDRIKEPVGLLPNKAIADAWKNNFSEKNLINFRLITEKYQIKDY